MDPFDCSSWMLLFFFYLFLVKYIPKLCHNRYLPNPQEVLPPDLQNPVLHYSKLKENVEQYCPARDKEEIESLADLIQATGEVIENLSVSKLDTDEYKIIAGHKRCQACKLLVEERGLKEFAFLPCIVNNVSAVQESFLLILSNGSI